MAWFVYVMSPIDDRWDYLSTVEEIATKSAVEAARGKIRGYHNYGCVDPDDFAADFGSAQEIAAMHGWEGDFKQEARVFWLPEPDNLSFVYAFVWKQENNGMIFVVSPHPLPWLGNPSHLRSSRKQPPIQRTQRRVVLRVAEGDLEVCPKPSPPEAQNASSGLPATRPAPS